MSGLILPPVVMHNDRMARLTERHRHLRWFDQSLRDLDHRLSLVKATDTAEPPLRAGFWHIKRDNGGVTADSYMPIEGPEGGFIEPHAGILDHLRRTDLWRPGVMEERMGTLERAAKAKAKAKAEAKEERVDEIATAIKATENPGILFNDRRWSARADARRAK